MNFTKKELFGVCFYLAWLISTKCVYGEGEYRCKKEIPAFQSHKGNGKISQTSPSTATPTNGTLQDYNLKVTNTGPIVVGSFIDFHAVMEFGGHPSSSDLFLYLWHNDADNFIKETEDDFTANLKNQYFNPPGGDGEYKMRVCVYNKKVKGKRLEHHPLVAQADSKFRLTVTLNGNYSIIQNLHHTRQQNALATYTPIRFNVHLTDTFNRDYRIYYIWRHNNIMLSETEEPWCDFVLNKTENNAELSVIATLTFIDVPGELIRNSYKEPREIKKIVFDGSKTGVWQKNFQIQDEIMSVNVSGETSINVDDMLNFTVTYNGSNPTWVCWMLCDTDANGNRSCDNRTCSEPITGDVQEYDIHIEETLPGQYNLTVSVENGVSVAHAENIVLHIHQHKSDPDEKSSYGYVIPVVFVCIGSVILISGFALLIHHKKRHTVEEANFDFHPHISRSATLPVITSIRRKMSDAFLNIMPSRSKSFSGGAYGSVQSDNSRASSLYSL